jgi:heterodisulfide reductase subunit A
MIADIRSQGLDGLVIAACSAKLHLFTFRSAAERAELNPYKYVHVNLREQCSWAHTDDPEGATEKAIRMVSAGIARAARARALETIRLETEQRALIIGAGVAGLRAALALDDIGISVVLVERASEPGGRVARLGAMYPSEAPGREIVAELLREVRARPAIELETSARVVEKSGCVGDFTVRIRKHGGEESELRVGAILVTTGFAPFTPATGEYGYGSPAVVTLPEFREMLDRGGPLMRAGREVRSVAYIYCVGSRQDPGCAGASNHCSRYCCNAAMHAALLAPRDGDLEQFHLYRDIRTYGKYEALYERARAEGSVFIRFSEEDPPRVELDHGAPVIHVKDLLTGGEMLEMRPDLVVLVTGMVPAENQDLIDVLKVPVGKDGFLNEVHPKLRPVETLINGVMIAGACQGPKNCTESAASALSAAAKAGALLKRGYVELEPLAATVETEACEWCDACETACPYGAISRVERDGKAVAAVNDAICKGCGACVPVCARDALHVRGLRDVEVTDMIDAMAREVPV